MRIIWFLLKKELLLLIRDWHALLLLFLMPAIFILVMSLALQNRFSSHNAVDIEFYLVNRDTGVLDSTLTTKLQTLEGFHSVMPNADLQRLKADVRAGKPQFLLLIPKGFNKSLTDDSPVPLRLLATPDVSPTVYKLFQSSLQRVLASLYVQRMSAPNAPAQNNDDSPSGKPVISLSAVGGLLQAHTLYTRGGAPAFPSSVQQNVPAWLLFAMFFIAIPVSTTWVREQDQGTYMRLRAMGLRAPTLLTGKMLAYLGLNWLQVVLMLLVGVFVVPWLGGGTLTLGHSWPALVLMALAASYAAVAYALLVANLVTTSEQATIFTGVANLLMAVLGGIMVPRFIMPPALQALSQYSPMAWGLDGFLDIFLRDGGVRAIANPALKLAAFGCACLLIAGLHMRWRGAG